MINRQMELGLATVGNTVRPHTRHGRKKANWWFAQMRRAVALAPDWPVETQAPAASGQAPAGQAGFAE